MKFLQILLELAVIALAVIEIIFNIQLNSTVRVPIKMIAIPVAIVVLVLIILTFEFTEIKNNREKKKKLTQKYEDEINSLKEEKSENTSTTEEPTNKEEA